MLLKLYKVYLYSIWMHFKEYICIILGWKESSIIVISDCELTQFNNYNINHQYIKRQYMQRYFKSYQAIYLVGLQFYGLLFCNRKANKNQDLQHKADSERLGTSLHPWVEFKSTNSNTEEPRPTRSTLLWLQHIETL